MLEQFKSWLDVQPEDTTVLPKSAIGVAVRYALNQWKPLLSFTTDGSLPIDNNDTERDLRRLAIGRKNYLFAGNEKAAENLSALHSVLATCELHEVNPEEYLTDVLTRVHTHPASKIDDLLPHR